MLPCNQITAGASKNGDRSVFLRVVEVEVTGEPVAQGYCHCESCRSMAGAPVRGFTVWPTDAVRVTRGEDQLKGYSKTDFSDRRHCANCGGQVLIHHPTIAMTDVHSETLKASISSPGCTSITRRRCWPSATACPSSRTSRTRSGDRDETIPE